MESNFIIEPKQAIQCLNDNQAICLDCTWYLGDKLSSDDFYIESISGSYHLPLDSKVFHLDINNSYVIPETNTDLIKLLQHIGVISSNHKIIIYTNEESLGGPRVLWVLKAYGFTNVQLLCCSIPEWIECGGKTEPGTQSRDLSNILFSDIQLNTNMPKGVLNTTTLATTDEVISATKDGNCVIIDARQQAVYKGESAGPRNGYKLGHIPGAINIPSTQCFLSDDKLKYRTNEEISNIFAQCKNSIYQYHYCGSGVTACRNAVANKLIGSDNVKVYLGSWKQYGDIEKEYIVET